MTGLVGAVPARPSRAESPRRVVVAELFTSEGCSSCPPADQLLQKIVAGQPIDGVEIVGLEEHVDYFDHLGWRDPFSSEAITRRQSQYSTSVFHGDEIYTPQLVVNGEQQCIGSDAAAVRRALTSVKAPLVDVSVSLDSAATSRLHGRIVLDASRGGLRSSADVVVAVLEDDLTTRVRGGENSGRVLTHTGVVRSMTTVGRLERETQGATIPLDVALTSGLQAPHLRAVVLVQDRNSRRILGAAVVRVSGT